MARPATGSIEKRGDGVWRVRVTGAVGEDGYPTRLSETVHGTRADAERVKARLLYKVGAAPMLSGSVTLSDFLNGPFLAYVEHLRPTTATGYKKKIVHDIEPALGDVLLHKLSSAHIQRFVDGFETAGACLSAFSVLRNSLNRARDLGYIDENPCNRCVVLPSRERPAIVTLEPGTEAAWLDGLHGSSIEAAAILSLRCGLRREEVAALTWSDVSLGESPAVLIDKTLTETGGEVFKGATKTTKSRRVVPIPRSAAERLRELKGLGYVCAYPDGSQMRPSALARTLKRECRARGLQEVTFTDLRHTFGSLCASTIGTDGAQIDATLAASIMGHSTVQTLFKYYYNPADGAKRVAVDALEAVSS